MITKDMLETLHDCSRNNESRINRANLCSCFHCLREFQPSEVKEWCDKPGKTAICPYCSVDAVIAFDISPEPSTMESRTAARKSIMKAMQDCWFSEKDAKPATASKPTWKIKLKGDALGEAYDFSCIKNIGDGLVEVTYTDGMVEVYDAGAIEFVAAP